METTRRSTVVGVFDESERARDAIQALKDSGFAASDISILMKDRGQAREMAEDASTAAAGGTGVPAWSEGQVVPPASGSGSLEDGEVPLSLEDEDIPSGNYPGHEHRFVGDVCEICGATRPDRRAA